MASGFRRGFKAEAERIALELRTEIGIGSRGRLDPGALAEHLCVPVLTIQDLVRAAPGDVRYFLGAGRSVFSAATIYLGRYRRLIITNPAHAATRQLNSLCHELSHIVLEHEGEVPLKANARRSWDGIQEREADWLAGCLLVTQEAAHAAARAGRSDEEVANAFGISVALAAWRMNATGARIRAQRLGRFGPT